MLQKGPIFGFCWRKPDLMQTGYNEFRIKRIPDITFLGEFFNVIKGDTFVFLAQTRMNANLTVLATVTEP